MTRPVRTAELSGSESALVIAALFALAEWPFETASARKLVSDEHKVAGQRLSEIVSARWQALLEAAGSWNPGSTWTPELIAERAALKPALSLSAPELPLVILALDAVAMEFSDNWDELCTVVPGAVQWYPVGPEDVASLARRLESMLVQ